MIERLVNNFEIGIEYLSKGERLTAQEIANALLRETGNIPRGNISTVEDPLYGEPVISGSNIRIEDIVAAYNLTEAQRRILINNAENYALLQWFIDQYKPPEAISRPGGIWNHLAQASFTEAFVFSEQALNVDGPTLNPLRFTMVGENAVQYHPVVVFLSEGSLVVPVVSINPQEIKSFRLEASNFSSDIIEAVEIYRMFPVHPYNFSQRILSLSPSLTGYLNVYPLMSKRSMLREDGSQIKLSLDLQITSRRRPIHWSEAVNAIENTKVALELAERGLLPENVWVIPDIAAYKTDSIPSSTFIMRAPLNEAIGRGSVPIDECIPVAMCSLWSNSVFGRSLLEDMQAAGLDVEEIIKTLIKMTIYLQLDLMEIGFVPESHSQNLIVLLDRQTGMPRGFLLRDCEGAKIDVEKMQKFGIDYNGIFNPEEHATSSLPVNNPPLKAEIITKYLHHCIFDSNIHPLAKFLVERLGKRPEEVK